MNSLPIYEIAKLIDHALLHPTLTDVDLRLGCQQALAFDVASVCIKPYAVSLAKDMLAGSSVRVGTVIGFPHGSNALPVKIAETVQACRDGATEIDMVVNIGKVVREDWPYVTDEIRAIQYTCQSEGAILKVIFETDFLMGDAVKIRLCQICSEVGVAFVKTSTGFGFVKGADGSYNYEGATDHDVRLLIDKAGPDVRVKASGGIRTLDHVLRLKDMGVSRVGTSSTAEIMNEAYRRSGKVPLNPASPSFIELSGY
ncbi:deoxyribose-phosphate aldolase [Spirosoma aerophilum]